MAAHPTIHPSAPRRRRNISAGRRGSRPLLPRLPVGARAIGDAAGVVENDGGGVVFIRGSAAYAWDAGDEGARRFAAVRLVRTATAKPGAVATAFSVAP
ncbi:MAG: hypothetical protein ACRDZ5_12475 [Acidimicrobiales bacterium]